MELMFVKLKNGEELVSYILEESDTSIKLEAPMLVDLNPDHGFMVKEWLHLSEYTYITLSKNDVLFATLAGERAKRYYQEYSERFSEKRQEFSDIFDREDINEDLEELFTNLLESKTSTKH